MGNFSYGKSYSWFDEYLGDYNKRCIANLANDYYGEIKDNVIFNSMYSKLDSVILYSFIRRFGFKNILEIGGGCSTNIIFQALEKNKQESRFSNYTLKLQANLNRVPDNVDFKYYEGDALSTIYDNPIDFENIDFAFIDGAHEAFFAAWYCFEVLEKLNKSCIIHIHDVQPPAILDRGFKNGTINLAPNQTKSMCDEMYMLVHYLKNKNYEVLLSSSDLIENHGELVSFISEVEQGKCRSPQVTAPATSLWVSRRNCE